MNNNTIVSTHRNTYGVHETYYPDGIHAVVVGKYRRCVVYPDGKHYVYRTHNGSKHGIRYNMALTYDDAIEAAMKWANRKLQK